MKENYLDYIPKRNPRYDYQMNRAGRVELIVPNRGICNRICQIFLKKPKNTCVELEEMGSFIWKSMDGKKSVYELALLERKEFGEEAEPVYERVSAYLKVLRSYNYIIYVKKKKTL